MDRDDKSTEGMFNLDPETIALRAKVLNGQKMKRYLSDTAAKVAEAWEPPKYDEKIKGVRRTRLAEVYNIQTREIVRKPELVPITEDKNVYQGLAQPADGEPIFTFLNEKDLEFCDTWEKMSAVFGLKGVPHHRLSKPDGSPADFRVEEKDGGLMVEIL